MSGRGITEAARSLARAAVRGAVAVGTCGWRAHSRLMLVSDSPAWSIGHDMRELSVLARSLGVPLAHPALARYGTGQCVFMGNHMELLLGSNWLQSGHRLATAYFHGRPGQGVEEFDRCFEALSRSHDSVHRVQVSCGAMRDVVLRTGIAPGKVHWIPIGINPRYFSPITAADRREARDRWGLPMDAVVIGSFQKDGSGWGEGLEPKHIKGPDVFLETIQRLRASLPNLHVLLSGPARGFVKAGLERLGVPYRHVFLPEYSQIGSLYHGLDAYVVSSREEGGPKAVLECMASGIPLISTRVGQAVDLVKHGVNGWLADVEDAGGLAGCVQEALADPARRSAVVAAGLETARQHTYESQLPLWRQFFTGFVG